VNRLKTRLSLQTSVDVGSLDLGLTVACAAFADGVDIIEMGTQLLKTQGFERRDPRLQAVSRALLLADMKTMDGGGGEARSVYAGGGNFLISSLSPAWIRPSICAMHDEFSRSGSELPRLVFSDIMVPHRVPPRRQARSRFEWSRPASTRSVSTCNPPCGAQPRNSSGTGLCRAARLPQCVAISI
jgi:hypothetical protein